MVSPIDRFNERKKKTKKINNSRKESTHTIENNVTEPKDEPKKDWKEQLQDIQTETVADKTNDEANHIHDDKETLTPEQTEIDFNKQFEESEEYKQLKEAGHDHEFNKITSQQELDEAIKKAKDILNNSSKANDNQEQQQPNTEEVIEKQSDDIPTEEVKEEHPIKNESKTLVVEGYEQEKEQPIPENQNWIEEKRAFYQQYAQKEAVTFRNDVQKDTEENSLTFSFEQDGKSLGDVKYTSPNSVQINKNSTVLMYQAIVQDALKNDLTLSFGKSLDDKQKAMLLAAVLTTEPKKYANGEEIALKNEPQIDISAPYFKELPQDVQNVLKQYAEKQAQQTSQGQEKEPENTAKTHTPANEQKSSLVQERLDHTRQRLQEKRQENPKTADASPQTNKQQPSKQLKDNSYDR